MRFILLYCECLLCQQLAVSEMTKTVNNLQDYNLVLTINEQEKLYALQVVFTHKKNSDLT